ncbi:MAG: hypothetical protein SGJ27_24670 [Candidatus Melainabacteria bacterium]|nr:hypothetical protein [Candidatus Melainabacteria bacterium]
MQKTAIHSLIGLNGFHSGIATAIIVACADRQAATVSRAHHEERMVAPDRLNDETLIRFLSVIGDIPNKVRQEIGVSMTWDDDHVVPVMLLSHQEYPGPKMRSPYQQPESSLSVDRLCFAAPLVYSYLEDAGYQPHLKYVYNGDIRTYSLQIAIRINTGK